MSKCVVGILGGGQLGRMTALAAINLGVKVKCLDPTPNAPASVAAEQTIGDFKNPEDILNFAKGCDVLTVEIEHVDVGALRKVQEQYEIPVQPSPNALEIIQDKYRQKVFFKSRGLPVGSAIEVKDYESIASVCDNRLPIMLKSKRLAYDGRGNYVIRSKKDIQAGVNALGGYDHQLYVEDWVEFEKELAVMVARSIDGTVLSYPVAETIHKDSICFVTEAPAAINEQVKMKAKQIAEEAISCLRGAGIFGVEMFLLENNEVLINEVAPRPHNSGHYTIDACSTSQFEQHIRAIMGLPLGDPSLIVGSAIMLNILGEDSGIDGHIKAQNVIQKSLSISGAKAHWYEKSDVKENRKVGHVNIIASSREKARNRLRLLNAKAYKALASHSMNGADKGANTQVSIIMGSDSDLVTMKSAAMVLEDFGIAAEVTVVSAHRTPERMVQFAKTAHERGIKVIIAGAGGAAHLPGMVAALTPLPVIGVPCVPSGSHLDGIDSILSIAQMPKGVPVATVAIGNAANAGLLAVRILSTHDASLQQAMLQYQDQMRDMVMAKAENLSTKGWKSYK